MTPLYRVAILLALVAGYVLCTGDFAAAPFVYGRLFLMFAGGAVIALFLEGPQYGTLQPISARPVMVFIGVLLMGTSLLWTFAIKGHL